MTYRLNPQPAVSVKTRFLNCRDIAAIVHKQGLEFCFTQLLQYLRADYLRWGAFDKSARIAKYSRLGVIELMPIADDKTYGFKCVNGHPGNTALGLPTVMAFGALADVDSGAVELISELTLTTALRTAATSAMFGRELARPDSRCMALIGNGAQAEFQALAFHYLLGINEFRLFDVDVRATEKLVRNLHGDGLTLSVCDSVAQAVHGADIITTVTANRAHASVLTAEMIEPGMHINAVGGDCPGKTELDPAVLALGPVFVEYEPQTRVEGELQRMPADFPVTEFWQVLQGIMPGRTRPGQITVFDSVGFALEDFSALRFVRDMAYKLDIGEFIQIVPDLSDPKNLFGMIRPGVAPVVNPLAGSAQPQMEEELG
jgi:ornithine cyclodeaminase